MISCTASGSANSLLLTASGYTAYADGDAFLFKAPWTNTAGMTIDVNSLGAITAGKNRPAGVTALTGGEMKAGLWYLCVYDADAGGTMVLGALSCGNAALENADFMPSSHPNQGGASGPNLARLDQNNVFSSDQQIIQSDDPTCLPAFASLTGAVTPGDVVGLRLFYDSGNHDYTYTVRASDTLPSIAQAVVDLINADAAGRALGMFSQLFGTSTVLVNPPWNRVPTLTSVNGAGATETWSITQSPGTLDGNPYHALVRYIAGYFGQVGDLLGSYGSYGQDSNGNLQQYGLIINKILSAVAGAAKGVWQIQTPDGCMDVGDGVIVYSQGPNPVAPYGGRMGNGTVNIPGTYHVNGVPCVRQDASRMAVDPANARNLVERRLYALGPLNVVTWQTIQTLTPSSLSGRAEGMIEARLMCDTATQGQGAKFSRWFYRISGGTLSAGIMGTDVADNTGLGFRVNVSGGSLQVQVQSPDAVHAIDAGLAEVTYYLTDAAGTDITWTIS